MRCVLCFRDVEATGAEEVIEAGDSNAVSDGKLDPPPPHMSIACLL